MGASGGSLKFTIPTNSGAGASGQWFTNFTPNLLTQIGALGNLYIQWRQRFSSVFLNTVYAPASGWKTTIIGVGDQPGSGCSAQTSVPCAPSCTTNDVVVQNTFLRGFPQMYNSCTGSASHGPYFPFERTADFGNGIDISFQDMPAPYCLYSQGLTNPKTFFPPAGNCYPFVADEWMTFQVHIATGPWVNGEYQNSLVELWVARANQAPVKVFNFTINLSAGNSPGEPYGKIWLLPYHTDKDASQATAVGYTWYDELIISTQKIAEPSGTPGPLTPGPAQIKLSGFQRFGSGAFERYGAPQ